MNKIHTAKPASCEALLKVPNKSVTEENNNPDSEILEEPEQDIQSEEIESFSIEQESSSVVGQGDDEYEEEEEEEEEIEEEEEEETTTEESSPVSVKGGDDLDGKPCASSGQQKCADAGESGKWLTCNIDKWLVRDCAAGLVCNESESGIYCDTPKQGVKAAAAASVVVDSAAESLSEVFESSLPKPSILVPEILQASIPSIDIPQVLEIPVPQASVSAAELPPVAAGLAEEASQASVAEQAAHPMVEDMINRNHQASLAVENPILAAQII